jgi:NAD(P)-dependent dehydrogenase (short-subunit alcohol dehydrogenase family)
MALDGKPEAWQDAIDVNLTGVFNTVEAAIPSMTKRGAGGVILMIGSTSALTGLGGPTRGGLGYTAAKHGVIGLMRAYANNLAPHRIRVNSIHPTGVRTPMVINDAMREFLVHDPSLARANANALPVRILEPADISEAVLWLASDAARYITGVALPVDAGFTNKK